MRPEPDPLAVDVGLHASADDLPADGWPKHADRQMIERILDHLSEPAGDTPAGVIPLSACTRGTVYLLNARTLTTGVFDGVAGFTGIREKFGSRFLFCERHWDSARGSARPLKVLGPLPDGISPTDTRESNSALYAHLEAVDGALNRGRVAALTDLDELQLDELAQRDRALSVTAAGLAGLELHAPHRHSGATFAEWVQRNPVPQLGGATIAAALCSRAPLEVFTAVYDALFGDDD